MHPYTYRIRFLFWHPTLDLSEVCNKLGEIPGLNTNRPANFGADRFDLKGNRLEGKYFDSRWGFDFNTGHEWQKSADNELSDTIEELLSKLLPYKTLLNDLSEKGCALDMIVALGAPQESQPKYGLIYWASYPT